MCETIPILDFARERYKVKPNLNHMYLLTINWPLVTFLVFIGGIFLLLITISWGRQKREKESMLHPKKLSKDDAGNVFKVLTIDETSKKVLLQHGIDWMEEVLFDRYWYFSENIPAQLLVKGKGFKVLPGEQLQFQEVFEYVHPKDDFAASHIIEKGKPVTQS